jgi:hypothetical protein
MPFPVDIEMVKRTEAKLGRALPAGYVAKMRRANGGSVRTQIDTWQLHPIFDDSDKTRLKRTCNDIVRETDQNKNRPDFPTEAVAIGANGGGDLLVILPASTPDRFADAVYWWDHETGEIEKVADDFDELRE